MDRFKMVLAAGLAVAVLAGLFVMSALAQPGPGSSRAQECLAVLPRETVDPILAKYRDRIQTARETLVKEERTLRDLLIADATTRAALDSQIAKTNDARAAFARIELDMLWELRAVIPAQNRAQAFRCAQLLLLRRPR